MYAYFRQMPVELEEAALVDGCSRWQALWKVACRSRPPASFGRGVRFHLLLYGVPVRVDPHEPGGHPSGCDLRHGHGVPGRPLRRVERVDDGLADSSVNARNPRPRHLVRHSLGRCRDEPEPSEPSASRPPLRSRRSCRASSTALGCSLTGPFGAGRAQVWLLKPRTAPRGVASSPTGGRPSIRTTGTGSAFDHLLRGGERGAVPRYQVDVTDTWQQAVDGFAAASRSASGQLGSTRLPVVTPLATRSGARW